MDIIGSYEERPFPSERNPIIDTVRWGRRKHHIPVLLEIDVTAGRARIREVTEETGEGLSFTGWVVACLAKAASEHPHVHALRKGGRRLVLFHDVDVTVVVERETAAGEKQPMPYVVRRANDKNVWEIHREIRQAQAQAVGRGETQIAAPRSAWVTRLACSLPAPVRDLFWRQLRDPFFVKRTMGTVNVTSVAGLARGTGSAWAIPVGIQPLVVALTGIARKPGVAGDEIAIREYLCMTVLFDHDVTDGAPVARFLGRLRELMEGAYGLDP